MIGEYWIYIGVGFVGIIFLLTLNVWKNFLYECIKHWREVVFFQLCIIMGVGVGLNYKRMILYEDIKYAVSYQVTKMGQPDETDMAATIRRCKSFVEAKYEGKDYDLPPRKLAGLVEIGTSSSAQWE